MQNGELIGMKEARMADSREVVRASFRMFSFFRIRKANMKAIRFVARCNMLAWAKM